MMMHNILPILRNQNWRWKQKKKRIEIKYKIDAWTRILFYFVFQLLLHIFIYALGSSSQVIHFCYRPSIHPTILQFKTIIIISRHNDLMQNEMMKKYKRRNKEKFFFFLAVYSLNSVHWLKAFDICAHNNPARWFFIIHIINKRRWISYEILFSYSM